MCLSCWYFVWCCVWKSGGQQFGRCHSLSWRQEVTQVRHYFGCYTFVFWPSYLYLLLCNFNLEGLITAIQRRQDVSAAVFGFVELCFGRVRY